MGERLERMGAWESGLYGYYSGRLGLPDPYILPERFLLQYICQEPPATLVHVGCGIGMFTAKLAALGIRVVGYEKDPRRVRCALSLRDTLGLDYEIRPAYYPEQLSESGGMLLFTNVGAEWTDEIEASIIATLPRFDRVILDVARFGRERDDPEVQAELMSRLPGEGVSLWPRRAFRGYHEFRP